MNEAYFSNSNSFISVLTADMRSVSYNLDIPERSNDPIEIEEVELEGPAKLRTFFAFGLNHKTAPVEVREKLHIEEAEIPAFLELLRETLSECVILSTCNRTEIYAVSESANIDLDYYKNLLIDFKGADGHVKDGHFFALISCAACQQLFNVATSIDSKVIGDSQILRQLRGAYSKSLDHGFTGKVMHQLLQRAFKLGKQTYNETNIHDGAVSASLAAVELAIEQFGSLRNRTALVIGAGEMARQTAEALANKKVGKLLVTNRTRLHAEQMLESLKRDLDIEAEVVGFENFRGTLADVDVLITSTGSDEPILFPEDFVDQQREIIVIDIAVPRDVDESVANCKNVVLKNIDDLNSIVDGTREKRLKDLPKVRKMIMNEMVDFLTWYYTLPLMPAYEKTGVKPGKDQTREVLRIKEFLNQNVSEIHRLYARTNGNFNEDLASHFDLVKRLQSMKQRSFAAGV